jgi:sugar lactone lactonase YvrE
MRKPGRRLRRGLGLLLTLLVLYLLFWPVPLDPAAWEAPPNAGYTGPHAVNHRLAGLEELSIGEHHGPEAVAIDDVGRIYAATHGGAIVRLDAAGRNPEVFADTGGRPLGIVFDFAGHLLVADAFLGLLSIDRTGNVEVLADEADGIPIVYADDVDVAPDGRVYFSDASTKFSAREAGDTMEASKLELIEHAGTGRLLVYDPGTRETRTVADGMTFPNGVAVSPDGQFVLVTETGSYRVLKVWLTGARAGVVEPLIEGLPGFPDNITTGQKGRFWLALVSSRNPMLDALAGAPFLRRMIVRLPPFMRPDAVPYGHVIAIDAHGQVLEDLQDPDGAYPLTTSVTETDDSLYIGSLVAPVLGRISKQAVGID